MINETPKLLKLLNSLKQSIFLCDLRLRQNLRSVLAGSPYKRMQEEGPLFLCAFAVKKTRGQASEE